MEDYINL
jgi:hypothetical protein